MWRTDAGLQFQPMPTASQSWVINSPNRLRGFFVGADNPRGSRMHLSKQFIPTKFGHLA